MIVPLDCANPKLIDGGWVQICCQFLSRCQCYRCKSAVRVVPNKGREQRESSATKKKDKTRWSSTVRTHAPLHRDGRGEVDAAAVRDGGEGVEDGLVDVREGPRLRDPVQRLDLEGGLGVDDERAEQEDDVVHGEGDEEDVEGVALHAPEVNNMSRSPSSHLPSSEPAGADRPKQRVAGG